MKDSGALHALFLRAINVGDRRITNEELLAPLIDAGFTDVAAFQAAGNIVFRAGDATYASEASIASLLTDAYGFDTPVFMRSEPALRSVIARCPFTADQVAATTGKIQVTFMASEPADQLIAHVAEVTPDEDLVAFDGREWFWLPVDGVSNSKLRVPTIERIVGPMTMRTLGTLERLLGKFAA